jgi:hypothetical protein
MNNPDASKKGGDEEKKRKLDDDRQSRKRGRSEQTKVGLLFLYLITVHFLQHLGSF